VQSAAEVRADGTTQPDLATSSPEPRPNRQETGGGAPQISQPSPKNRASRTICTDYTGKTAASAEAAHTLISATHVSSSRALEAFEIQRDLGGAAVFEQPEPRAGEPSLFHSPRAVAWLANARVKSGTGDQCPYGAASTKPTELRPVGMELPEFEWDRCSHQETWRTWTSNGTELSGYKAHIPLFGRNEYGQWRTAPSARYPYELCKYIAEQCFLALYALQAAIERLEAQSRRPWHTSTSPNH
jgi:hypothetical protein